MSARAAPSTSASRCKHGAGGRAMRALIEQVFARGLAPTAPVDGIGLAAMDDGAALRVGDRWLVLTTDSHVVHPLFFPGGDIGRLAVAGHGQRPGDDGRHRAARRSPARSILEEGFPRADLERIQALDARRPAARPAPRIVTGDTKVMGRGELDGIVINTTGVGAHRSRRAATRACAPATGILVTGTIGDHGMAVHGHAPRARARGRAALRRGADQRADRARRSRPAAAASWR